MEYIKATQNDIEQITNLVRETIKTVYPKFYPKEIVDFFCDHHCREKVALDIEKGTVGILIKDGIIIGTGSYEDNHITRVYVAPKYQGQGYGSYIMQTLENVISINHEIVYLDASLPASHMYEARGYKTSRHEKLDVANGVVLVYEVMEKRLQRANASIEHIAMYVNGLESARDFFVKYFNATSNSGYHNKTTDFRSYFLTFNDGTRLEIMNKPDMVDDEKSLSRTGYAHIAFSVGSKEAVNELTMNLQKDGYEVLSGPRTTGDGYYESCVIAIEGNQIEITV